MLYIAICDDNREDAEGLRSKTALFLKEDNVLADVSVYIQSQMLQYDIEEGKYFDLILSDIEMPDTHGMDLAAYIKGYLPEVLIIFHQFTTF